MLEAGNRCPKAGLSETLSSEPTPRSPSSPGEPSVRTWSSPTSRSRWSLQEPQFRQSRVYRGQEWGNDSTVPTDPQTHSPTAYKSHSLHSQSCPASNLPISTGTPSHGTPPPGHIWVPLPVGTGLFQKPGTGQGEWGQIRGLWGQGPGGGGWVLDGEDRQDTGAVCQGL